MSRVEIYDAIMNALFDYEQNVAPNKQNQYEYMEHNELLKKVEEDSGQTIGNGKFRDAIIKLNEKEFIELYKYGNARYRIADGPLEKLTKGEKLSYGTKEEKVESQFNFNAPVTNPGPTIFGGKNNTITQSNFSGNNNTNTLTNFGGNNITNTQTNFGGNNNTNIQNINTHWEKYHKAYYILIFGIFLSIIAVISDLGGAYTTITQFLNYLKETLNLK